MASKAIARKGSNQKIFRGWEGGLKGKGRRVKGLDNKRRFTRGKEPESGI